MKDYALQGSLDSEQGLEMDAHLLQIFSGPVSTAQQ